MTATIQTARPAYRDGNVLRWLAAFLCSLLGDNVYFLALSWAAIQTGGPVQAGLVLAAASVPRAVFMLGGGVLADRFGPRKVLISSDSTRCVVMLVAAGVLALSTPGVWLLVLVGLVFGTVDALFLPAVGALPPRITGPDQLARVQGLRGLATRAALIVGSPLGGLAMAWGGPSVAFLVAGALFTASLPLLITVRLAPNHDDGVRSDGTAWQDLLDGLRYSCRDRIIGPLVVVLAICELGFTGPLNIGAPLLANEHGWGATGYAWLIGAFGIGAAVGSVLLTVRGWIPRAGLVQQACLAFAAAAIGAIAFVPTLFAAVGVAVIFGMAAGLSSALGASLLQTSADPAYLGRVTAVLGLLQVGLAPLTYPVTGAAVAAWGTRPVFAASAALIAVAPVVGLCARALRSAELPR